MTILDVQHLTKNFGGLRANNDVSFSLEKGELLGVIGPNGAGKTTLFNCISGMYPLTSGKIVFDGVDITNSKAHEIARQGLARTFQVYVASGDLSVAENVMVGCFMHTRSTSQAKSQTEKILEDLKLRDLAENLVSELPVAAQKRVTMATALGTEPKLLLLDEVAAGLNPSEIDDMLFTIQHIHQDLGITVMLIEHVMELVMRISHRLIVLDYGKKIAEGNPGEIAKNPLVIQAYLGERYIKEHSAKGIGIQ